MTDSAPRARTLRIRDQFVESWSRLASLWGLPPATWRVHGWLLTQPGPTQCEAIQLGLGMGRASVQAACRELAERGLAQPERVPAATSLGWRPEIDLRRAIHDIAASGRRAMWEPLRRQLRDWIPVLQGDSSEEACVFRERLEAIATMVDVADSMAQDFERVGLLQRLGLGALLNPPRTRPSVVPKSSG